MPDPYEVDDEGNPVAESDAVAETPARPAELEVLRRQVDQTLRFVAVSTVVGVAIIAILAALISGSRGVLILVGLVYLVTSTTAYFVLRRNLRARLARYGGGAGPAAAEGSRTARPSCSTSTAAPSGCPSRDRDIAVGVDRSARYSGKTRCRRRRERRGAQADVDSRGGTAARI